MLRLRYQVIFEGLSLSWPACCVRTDASTAGDGVPAFQPTDARSAEPLTTSVMCASGDPFTRSTISSGKPSGWAAADHSRNLGLRTSRTPRFWSKRRSCRGRSQARATRMERRPGGHREGRRERELVEEVGVGRGQVEGDGVRARSVTIPRERSHRSVFLTQVEAPTMPASHHPAPSESSPRSIARRKSSGRTSAPVE